MLLACFVADAVGLSVVKRHLLVNKVDHIGSDWSFEDGWESNRRFFFFFMYADYRTSHGKGLKKLYDWKTNEHNLKVF